MTPLPKIFITAFPVEDGTGNVVGFALAQDGLGLVQVLCKNKLYVKYEMGINSIKKHAIYQAHYPEFALVDLIDATDDELEANHLYMEALKINAEREDSLDTTFREQREVEEDAKESSEENLQ